MNTRSIIINIASLLVISVVFLSSLSVIDRAVKRAHSESAQVLAGEEAAEPLPQT